MNSALKLKDKLDGGVVDFTYPISKVEAQLYELHRLGYRRGYHCGFEEFYKYYSIVPGKLSYIVGSPTAGKSYFWMECLINLSQFFNLRHMLFSPEMGQPHEIYADLIAMYMGQKFTTLNNDQLDEAIRFVNTHFIIVDPRDHRFTIEDLFNQAELNRKKGFVVDTLTGDPFNEFEHDLRDDYNRQDLYIERILGIVRRKAAATNIHTCLITHPRDQQPLIKDGIRYFPPPNAREYAGGQAWFRKGLGMLGIWRPAEGLTDDQGIEYQRNEVKIFIQKAKPRGIGQVGDISLYFDTERWRYYEQSTFSGKQYARDITNIGSTINEPAPF
jgi:hypothetical protein